MSEKNLYETMKLESSLKGERNDCSVIALSIAADVNYSDAHKALASFGRKFRDGATMNRTLMACRALGHRVESVKDLPKCTMATVGRRLGKGRFMVLVRGHVAAVVDGEVQDWTDGRRHKVICAWRVLGE